MRRHLRLTAYSQPNRVHQPACLLLREHLGEPPIPGTVAREPGGTRGRDVRRRGKRRAVRHPRARKGRVKPRGGARRGGDADRGRGGPRARRTAGR
jgi:hypothetical protein